MNPKDIKTGMPVMTNVGLKKDRTFTVHPSLVKNRRATAFGMANQSVAGTYGREWNVKHPDGTIAVYGCDELNKSVSEL